MKGLSRKNFSQAGRRSMIGSLQLATQGCRSGSTTVATLVSESAQRNKDCSTIIPGQPVHSTLLKPLTLIITPLIDRLFLAFA